MSSALGCHDLFKLFTQSPAALGEWKCGRRWSLGTLGQHSLELFYLAIRSALLQLLQVVSTRDNHILNIIVSSQWIVRRLMYMHKHVCGFAIRVHSSGTAINYLLAGHTPGNDTVHSIGGLLQKRRIVRRPLTALSAKSLPDHV